ncbi:MAG: M20 family metallo-hydrolase [Bacteroidales bacterium]|nr:M20 family metallo-hydrolase [Bacteroidales bacterium]
MFKTMTSDDYYYKAIDLLKKLISKPSISRDETDAANIIENYLRHDFKNVYRSGNNVWVVQDDFDDEKPTILLNSHIDTVKPVAGWNKDPFSPIQEGDYIYGLGSNDAGASVVSLIHAFYIITSKLQSYNLIFLASCEEEVSGKNGIESVITQLPNISFAIVGEPTKMNGAIAEKGLMVVDGIVKGKAGHAARNEGINAIYKTLPIIEKLKNFDLEKESPLLGKTKFTVTQIQSGTQHNVVPDSCSFVVDIRTNECYSNLEVLELLKANIDCELTPRSTRLNSSSISPCHPFVKRLEILGRELFGSPTLSDQALMPFISIKIGPGDSARSHTADEYILGSEIREAIELYVKLLDGLKI